MTKKDINLVGFDTVDGSVLGTPMPSPSFSKTLSSSLSQDMSFARATAATIIDNEGNIQDCLSGEARFERARRVENTQSIDVLNGVSSISTNSTVTPMPDELDFEGKKGTVYRVQNPAMGDTFVTFAVLGSGVKRVFSCWVKSNGQGQDNFTMQTGSTPGLGHTATSEWERFTSAVSPSGTFYINNGPFGANAGDSYGTDILVCHPQIEIVEGKSNQAPSDNVSKDLVRRNMTEWSENLADSSWSKDSVFATGNRHIGSYGQESLSEIEVDAVSVHKSVRRTVELPGSLAERTISVVVRRDQKRYFKMFGMGNGGEGVTFDLQSASYQINGSWDSAGVEVLSDGLLRVWGTLTPLVSELLYLGMASDINGNAGGVVVGDKISFGEIQVEAGATRTDYQKTTNGFIYHGAFVDGVKYFNYENGNSVVNGKVVESRGAGISGLKGYRNEVIRTGLLYNTNNLTAAPWQITNSGVTFSRTSNYFMNELTTNVISEAVTSTHFILQDKPLSNGTTYTITVIAKPAGWDWIQIFPSSGFDQTKWVNVNLSTGQVGNTSVGVGPYTVEALNNGFYKVTYTATANATGNGRIAVSITNTDTTSRNPTRIGDGVSGVEFAYVGMEAGTFPTMPIKTEGASVTRNDDVLSITPSPVTGDFTFISEFATLSDSDDYSVSSNDYFRIFGSSDSGGANNEMRVFESPGTSYGVTVTGGGAAIKLASNDLLSADTYKLGISMNQINSVAKALIALDGDIKLDQNYSITLNHSDTSLLIGSWSGFVFSGNYKNVKIWDKGLTPSQLKRLT